MSASSSLAPPPSVLVGRERALEAAEVVLDHLVAGSPEPLAVTGLMQNGRSALLRVVIDRASDRGLLTAMTRADPQQSPRNVVAAGVQHAIDALAVRRPGARGIAQMRGAVVDYRASTTSGLALTTYEMLHHVGRGLRELGTGMVVGIDDVDRWPTAAVEALVRSTVAATDRGSAALLVPSSFPHAALRAEGQTLCNELTADPLDAGAAIELAAAGGLDLDAATATELVGLVDGRPGDLLRAVSATVSTNASNGPSPAAICDVARALARSLDDQCASTYGRLDATQRRYLRALAEIESRQGRATVTEIGRRLGDSNRFSAESSALMAVRESLSALRLVCCPDGSAMEFTYAPFRRLVHACD